MIIVKSYLNLLASSVFILLQHELVGTVDKDFWYYMLYILSIFIVFLVLGLTIKYLVQPREESKNHIKRRILEDESKDDE
ncbi:MAG: hypothetical protein IPM14_04795 [bacterium]|nr:hypothetical protein [bacterium]